MLSSSRSRVNVAAQACDTCRRRKSRCDELRPKCSLCQRLNVECRYQEQAAQKKDDNYAEMLDRLQRMEEKIDHISLTGTVASSPYNMKLGATSSSQQTPGSASSEGNDKFASDYAARSFDSPKETLPYFTAPHRTIVWPAIHAHIERFVPQAAYQLAQLLKGGTSWLLSQEMTQFMARLPAEVGMPVVAEKTDRDYSSLSSSVHFHPLTPERMRSYARAYFDTFNVIYPILDEAMFVNEVLPPLISRGFRYGDAASVLTLYVMALGQLATEASTGPPIGLVDGIPSGICGGSADHPPGLDIFNEGRARVGSLVVRGDVVSVQVLLLQGTYFEANACHVEYWRSVMEASLICQVLAQETNRSWSTLAGDLLRRAFWACVIDEDFYHLDLDLPRTNVGNLVDQIRLPTFSVALGSPAGGEGDGPQSPLAFYFLAKVSLQRVIDSIHQAVQLYSSRFEQLQNYIGPPLYVVSELSRQLDGWRAQLPSALQWSDEDLAMMPWQSARARSPEEESAGLLATAIDAHLTAAGFEILAVELRARFYYAKFILGRPFIFKALHFPEMMKDQDTDYCASAVEAGCLWPAALAPAWQKKRLLPHLFTWTQSFIAMLLILSIARSNECLGRICSERLGEEQLERVIEDMLHWIRDVKQIDGIAEWSWHFLYPLFANAEKTAGTWHSQ